MKALSMRGHKEVVWVDDDTATKIENILIDSTGSQFVHFDGRTINTADVRGVFTEADMGKKPDPQYLRIAPGEVMAPVGLSELEREREMKLMFDSYVEARNEVRAEKGIAPLTEKELYVDFAPMARRFLPVQN